MITDQSGIAGELSIDGGVRKEVEADGFLDEKGELTLRLHGVAASLVGRFDGRSFSGTLVTSEPDATSPFHFVAARSISGQTDDTVSSSESCPISLAIRSEPERTQVPATASSKTPSDDSRHGMPWLCQQCGRRMAQHVERCLCGLSRKAVPNMAKDITIQQYLAREDLQLATWTERECLRLELLMDYSDAAFAKTPDVRGVAAVRWSILADQFGNGLSRPNGVSFTQAILIGFLYAKILTLDLQNRAELFRQVQEAVAACEISDIWSSLTFKPWYIDGRTIAGSFQNIVWPWKFVAWSEVEARHRNAQVKVSRTTKSAIKNYTATLLMGPVTDGAPQGWWLRLQQPGPEFARVLLPASVLIAITNFLNEAEGDDRDVLSTLLRRINLYYESPDRIPFGAEAMAVRAAIRSVMNPEAGTIADYRCQDDAIRRQVEVRVQRMTKAAPSATPSWFDSAANWFRR